MGGQILTKFDGFSTDLIKFLKDLKQNNNREWFNDNKQRYRDSIVEPMCDFIAAMNDPLRKISPRFVADPRANGGSMFRIYRDTRFAKDKTPYKGNVGCHFRHQAGKDAHAPGFYLHIEPGNVFFGGGIWMPPNPNLNKIRTAIVESPKKWEKVKKNSSIKNRTDGIGGDGLKRAPRGYDENHPYIDDLKRKSFFAMTNSSDKLITDQMFMQEVVKTFKAVSPLMEFLTEAQGLAYR